MKLELVFKHARAILAGLGLVLVAGLITLNEIPKEAEPDIDLPSST